MKTLVKNGIVLIDGKRRIDNGAVLIEDEKIIGVYKDYSSAIYDQVIDAMGNYIIPGFLDTHTHGIMGHDFNTCTMDKLKVIEEASLNEGVTGFMVSLTCESHEDTIKLLDLYQQTNVSNMVGVHMEGPFLNINNKGVMKEEYIQVPSQEKFDDFLKHCSKIKSMTIAPDVPHALDLITYGYNKGLIMNIGHTSASASQVLEAQQYGAKGITHLYNAMSQHLHRDPGVVTGAILSDLMCELIVDGFHIHEDIIKATYKSIGKDRIILITDSNPCKGLPDGEYSFSGKNVQIIDGKARVKETGRIAGSTLTMNKACYHMMKYCGCSIDDVILMACYNPAQLYHLNKGQLEVGYDSDILIIDKDIQILAIINQGIIKKNMTS